MIRKPAFSSIHLSRLAWTIFALPALGTAQVHPEITAACDAKSNLVAVFDRARPFPLPPSRFTGISRYADAMPGFSSLAQARPDDSLFPPDPQSSLAFVLVSADEGMAVWNDHGSGTMRVGESFNLGNPFFDSHPVWNILNGQTGRTYSVRLRLRDLSGRYRDSEVFAPAFIPDEGIPMYACPMQCQQGVLAKENGHCPVCGMRLKLLSGRNYQVKVTHQSKGAPESQLRAGQETSFRFEITTPDGKPVNDLEIVHKKLLHLLLVSDDLSWFAHEHPQIQPDGAFVLPFTFPHPGGYTLFHDFTPARAGMQVVSVELKVSGEPPAPVPLKVSGSRTQQVDGYTIEFRSAPIIKSVQMQSLSFRLARDAAPITDLEPYLGALGHLIIISQDRKNFVHSHPLPTPPKGTVAPQTQAAGPEVVFNAQFPTPGLYKAWGQFQHHGRVITAPFVFEVVSPLGN